MQKNMTPGRRKGCPNYSPEFKQQLVAASCEPGITITGTDEKGNTGTYTLKPSYWVPYISSTKMPYRNENYIGSAVQTCKSHGASVMNKAPMTGIHSEWGNFYVYEGWERGYYQTSTAYSGSDPQISNWAFWAESNLWTKNSWSTLFFACE
ncbi:TPA: transposase [Klebsiella aerogenes]|nr:transposase [Klebsiella aerogenes]